MTDNINHPPHYTGRNIGYECIDIAQCQPFCTGNVIKYLWRHDSKGTPIEDLKKARWYATRASQRQEQVNIASDQCTNTLMCLITVTRGDESVAWTGLLQRNWRMVLSALDMMIGENENDTSTH